MTMNTPYPSFKGDYSESLRYSEEKRYFLVKAQRNKPLLDAEVSEIGEGLLTMIRRSVQNTFGDGLPYENFGAIPVLGSTSGKKHALKKDSFRVIPNRAVNLGNDFIVTGGNGTNDPAVLYYNGWYIFLTSSISYSQQSSAVSGLPVLSPGYTATRIPSLNAYTGVGVRTDVVYMEFRLAESSAETGDFESEYTDPSLKDTVLGSPTANRLRAVMDIRVLEDASSLDDWPLNYGGMNPRDKARSVYGLSFFTPDTFRPQGDYANAYDVIRVPIALISRSGNRIEITESDIFDLADHSGMRVFTNKEITHRLNNGGYTGDTVHTEMIYWNNASARFAQDNFDVASSNTAMYTHESYAVDGLDEGLTSKALNTGSVTPRTVNKSGRFGMASILAAAPSDVVTPRKLTRPGLIAHPDEMLAGEASYDYASGSRVLIGYSRVSDELAQPYAETHSKTRNNANIRGFSAPIRIGSKSFRTLNDAGNAFESRPDLYDGAIYVDVDRTEDVTRSKSGFVYMPGVVADGYGFGLADNRVSDNSLGIYNSAMLVIPMSSGYSVDRDGYISINTPMPFAGPDVDTSKGATPFKSKVAFRAFAPRYFASTNYQEYFRDYEGSFNSGAFPNLDYRNDNDRSSGARVSETYGVVNVGSYLYNSVHRVYGTSYVRGSSVIDGDQFFSEAGGRSIHGVIRKVPTTERPSLIGRNGYNGFFAVGGVRRHVEWARSNFNVMGGVGSVPDYGSTHGSFEVVNSQGVTEAVWTGEATVQTPKLRDAFFRVMSKLRYAHEAGHFADVESYYVKATDGTEGSYRYSATGSGLSGDSAGPTANPSVNPVLMSLFNYVTSDGNADINVFLGSDGYNALYDTDADGFAAMLGGNSKASVLDLSGDVNLYNIRKEKTSGVDDRVVVVVGDIDPNGEVVDGGIITDTIHASILRSKLGQFRGLRSKSLDTLSSMVGSREFYADNVIKYPREHLVGGMYAMFPQGATRWVPVGGTSTKVAESDMPGDDVSKYRKAFHTRLGHVVTDKSFFYDEILVGSDPIITESSMQLKDKDATRNNVSFVNADGTHKPGAVAEYPLADVGSYFGGTTRSRHVHAYGNTVGEWGSMVLFRNRRNRWATGGTPVTPEDFFAIRGETANAANVLDPRTLGSAMLGDTDDIYSRKSTGASPNYRTVHFGGYGVKRIVFDESADASGNSDIEIEVMGNLKLKKLTVDEIATTGENTNSGIYKSRLSEPVSFARRPFGGYHKELLIKADSKNDILLTNSRQSPSWVSAPNYDGVSALSFEEWHSLGLSNMAALSLVDVGSMELEFETPTISASSDYVDVPFSSSKKFLNGEFSDTKGSPLTVTKAVFTPLGETTSYNVLGDETSYRVNVSAEVVTVVDVPASYAPDAPVLAHEVSRSYNSSIPIMDMKSWFAYAVNKTTGMGYPGYSFLRNAYRSMASTSGWSDETAYFVEVEVTGYGSSVSPFEKMFVQLRPPGSTGEGLVLFKCSFDANMHFSGNKVLVNGVERRISGITKTSLLGTDDSLFVSSDADGRKLVPLNGTLLDGMFITPTFVRSSSNEFEIKPGSIVKMSTANRGSKARTVPDSLVSWGGPSNVTNGYPNYYGYVPLPIRAKDTSSTWLDMCLSHPGIDTGTEFTVVSVYDQESVSGSGNKLRVDMFLATNAASIRSIASEIQALRQAGLDKLVTNNNGQPRYLDGFFFGVEMSGNPYDAYSYANRRLSSTKFMTAADPYYGILADQKTGSAIGNGEKLVAAWGCGKNNNGTFYTDLMPAASRVNPYPQTLKLGKYMHGSSSAVLLTGDGLKYNYDQAYVDPTDTKFMELTKSLFCIVPGVKTSNYLSVSNDIVPALVNSSTGYAGTAGDISYSLETPYGYPASPLYQKGAVLWPTDVASYTAANPFFDSRYRLRNLFSGMMGIVNLYAPTIGKESSNTGTYGIGFEGKALTGGKVSVTYATGEVIEPMSAETYYRFLADSGYSLAFDVRRFKTNQYLEFTLIWGTDIIDDYGDPITDGSALATRTFSLSEIPWGETVKLDLIGGTYINVRGADLGIMWSPARSDVVLMVPQIDTTNQFYSHGPALFAVDTTAYAGVNETKHDYTDMIIHMVDMRHSTGWIQGSYLAEVGDYQRGGANRYYYQMDNMLWYPDPLGHNLQVVVDSNPLMDSIDSSVFAKAIPHYMEVGSLLNNISLANRASSVSVNAYGVGISLTDIQAKYMSLGYDSSEILGKSTNRLDGSFMYDVDPYDTAYAYDTNTTGSLSFPCTRSTYVFNLTNDQRARLNIDTLSSSVMVYPEFGNDGYASGSYRVEFDKKIWTLGIEPGDSMVMEPTDYTVGSAYAESVFIPRMFPYVPAAGLCPSGSGYDLFDKLGYLKNARVVKSNLLTGSLMDSTARDVSMVDGVLDMDNGETLVINTGSGNRSVFKAGTRGLVLGTMPVFNRVELVDGRSRYFYDVKLILANMNKDEPTSYRHKISLSEISGRVSMPLDKTGI